MQMPSLVPEPGSLFDRIATFVLANMLWFLFAILVIPLPAATAGLVATLAPLARNGDGELFATFFGTMRRQWLKSTIIFVADVALAATLVVNFQLLQRMQPGAMLLWLLRSIYIFIIIATLMVNLYLWPLLVMFDLHLRRLLEVSIRLAFAHPAWTLVSVGAALSPLALALFVPPLLSVVLVFSTSVLIANWGAWRVIRRYATPDELAALDRAG